jgi:GNAT superfamily N-acetyltransferase
MSKLRDAAQDFARHWREQGPKAALAYLWEIVRVQVYLEEDEIVVRKDFAADATPEPGPVRLEVAQAHHLPMLAEFNRRQANATRTRRFETGFAEGKQALVGFRDGELIGYFWFHDATVRSGTCYVSRYGIRLGEGEVYGEDLFIAPEHRGRGVPAAFVAALEAELVRLGYHRMYGFVDAFNTPARWLWTTSGYTVVTRRHTHRILRRFVIVEDEAMRNRVRDVVRPLRAIGLSGRRD